MIVVETVVVRRAVGCGKSCGFNVQMVVQGLWKG